MIHRPLSWHVQVRALWATLMSWSDRSCNFPGWRWTRSMFHHINMFKSPYGSNWITILLSCWHGTIISIIKLYMRLIPILSGHSFWRCRCSWSCVQACTAAYGFVSRRCSWSEHLDQGFQQVWWSQGLPPKKDTRLLINSLCSAVRTQSLIGESESLWPQNGNAKPWFVCFGDGVNSSWHIPQLFHLLMRYIPMPHYHEFLPFVKHLLH